MAAGLAAARLACADFDAISLDRKKEHPKASAEELDEYADCLKDVDRDDWEKSLTAFYTGTEATGLDAFRKDLNACNALLEADRQTVSGSGRHRHDHAGPRERVLPAAAGPAQAEQRDQHERHARRRC